MAAVDVRQVKKSFGATDVIHGIDVEIPDRAFVVLVGPSGCGKSTLLRMIAGLEDITGGEISIGGRVVNRVAPKERDIAMVFQNYALYPHMTVYENIGVQPSSWRRCRQDDHRCAGPSGVEDPRARREYLDRKPRAACRVASVNASRWGAPSFAQPAGVPDGRAAVQPRCEAARPDARRDPPPSSSELERHDSVYVTHDQIEAMTMADRIVVMQNGYVEQVGAPLDLYDHPANLFVAGFIGSPSMNFLPGTVRRTGDGAVLEAEDGTRLPIGEAAGAEDGQQVVFGTRPEHLELSANDDGVATSVQVVEPTGSETLVVGEMAGVQVQAAFRERHDFRPGQQIALRPRPDHIHLFHKDTGRRIAA